MTRVSLLLLFLLLCCALTLASLSSHEDYLQLLNERARETKHSRRSLNVHPLMQDWKPTRHPSDSRRFVEDSIFQGEDGESIVLKYDVHLKEEVVQLHTLDHVQDVVCAHDDNGFYVRSEDVESLIEVSTAVLGVTPKWQCRPNQETTVHGRVRNVQKLRDDVVYVEVEHVKDAISLMSSGNVEFIYTPGPKSSDNKRFDLGNSYDLFKDGINYDPEKNKERVTWKKKFLNDTCEVEMAAYQKATIGLKWSLHVGVFFSPIELEVVLFAKSQSYYRHKLQLGRVKSGTLFEFTLLSQQYLFSFPIPVAGIAVDFTLVGSLGFRMDHSFPENVEYLYELEQKFGYVQNYEIGFRASTIGEKNITLIHTHESYPTNSTIEKVNKNIDLRLYFIPNITLLVQPFFLTASQFLFKFYLGAELQFLNQSACSGIAAKYDLYNGLDVTWIVPKIKYGEKVLFNGMETTETWVEKTFIKEPWASGCVDFLFNKTKTQQKYELPQEALPAVNTYLFQLFTGTFFQGCDTFGKCDPFVKVAVCWSTNNCPAGFALTSTVIGDTNYPNWMGQGFYIYYAPPTTYFLIYVYDDDPFSTELLWTENVTLASMIGCGSSQCSKTSYDNGTPFNGDNIIIGVTSYPITNIPTIRPGSWITMRTLSSDEAYQVSLVEFPWTESFTILVRGNGIVRLYVKIDAVVTSASYDYTKIFNSSFTDWSLVIPGPLTNKTVFILASRMGTPEVSNFSIWTSPSKTFTSPTFSNSINFNTLPYTFYWLNFVANPNWDAVVVYVKSTGNMLTDLSIVNSFTYTTATTISNTLYVDRSFYTVPNVQFELYNHPSVPDYNVTLTSPLSVTLYPLFRYRNFGQAMNISYTVETGGIILFLVSINLPVTAGTTTIKFSKVVQSITRFNIPENANLDYTQATNVNNTDSITVNNAQGHVLLSVRDARGYALGSVSISAFPQTALASGVSVFLPALEYQAHYFTVNVPNFGGSNSRPLGLVTSLFSNSDANAVLTASLSSVQFPTQTTAEWVQGVAPSVTSSLYLSSTISTSPSQVNFGLLVGPTPAYIKVDVGYKFAIAVATSFAQTINNYTLLLNIEYPSAWAGAEVGCTAGNQKFAVSVGNTYAIASGLSLSPGIAYSQSTSNDGSNALWARIVKTGATASCQLYVSQLLPASLSLSPSSLIAANVRSGPQNISITLTGTQYAYVSDLTESPTLALAFVSSFFSNVAYQSASWNAVVRPLLISNPSLYLIRVSLTEVVVRLPQISAYNPPSDEAMVFALPKETVIPSFTTAPTASFTIAH